MRRTFLSVALGALAAAGTARAAQPEPWGIGLQPAATPVAAGIHDLYGIVFWIITGVCVLVLALLAFIIWRFRAARNPTPSRATHHAWLEVAWTAVPVMVIAAIAVPSIRLLYFMDRSAEAEMTLKVTGFQWYWNYEYPDHGGFNFDALMVSDDKLAPGQPRLLETDNRVLLPADTTVRILVTSQDVIHSWAVPAFGVKVDSVPGRVNEAWVRVGREGVYYGQCSELCGVNHAYMPIAVEVVARDAFAAWVDKNRKAAAAGGPTPIARR